MVYLMGMAGHMRRAASSSWRRRSAEENGSSGVAIGRGEEVNVIGQLLRLLCLEVQPRLTELSPTDLVSMLASLSRCAGFVCTKALHSKNHCTWNLEKTSEQELHWVLLPY
jgi:hypothetical protein